VESVSNITVGCIKECFNTLITDNQWIQLKKWSSTHSVSLRFSSMEVCSFVESKVVKVYLPTERQWSKGIRTMITGNILKEHTEYYWDVHMYFECSVFPGNDVGSGINIFKSSSVSRITTYDDKNPRFEKQTIGPFDLNITPFLQLINENGIPKPIVINREDINCKTPIRNSDVDKFKSFCEELQDYCINLSKYFIGIMSLEPNNNLPSDVQLFIPNIPVWTIDENGYAKSFDTNIQQILIKEFKKSKDSLFQKIDDSICSCISKTSIAQILNIQLMLINIELVFLKKLYFNSLEQVEIEQTRCLISALGKEVSFEDIDNLMEWRNRQIYNDTYSPNTICYPIQKSMEYDPEGTISIETFYNKKNENFGGFFSKPIKAFSNSVKGSISFKLTASIDVTIEGDKNIHGWLRNQFLEDKTENILIARSKCYSGFILVIGSLLDDNTMSVDHAIIVKNQNEILIPLILETIPSAKTFKKAVESLSEEQRAFAQAYRGMQLSGSLFTFCAIPIIPQLEQLLKLPEDSLSKELELYENILNLLIEYQIPSDLITYEGDDKESISTKIGKVKNATDKILDMINAEKKAIIEEERRKAAIEETNRRERERKIREEKERKLREERERRKRDVDLRKIEEEIESVKLIMLSNIDKVLERGERLDLLECKADDLSSQSLVFQKQAKSLSSFGSLMGGVTSSFSNPFKSSGRILPKSSDERKEIITTGNTEIEEAKEQILEVSIEDSSVNLQDGEINDNQEKDDNNDDKIENDEKKVKDENKETSSLLSNSFSICDIPKILDEKFEKLDPDDAICSTTIKVDASSWGNRRKSFVNQIDKDGILKEKNAAFDLLDILSRSGSLNLHYSTSHTIIASTHCFEKTLMKTLIQDNINPLPPLERSSLLISSTIFNLHPKILIDEEENEELQKTHLPLFQ